MSYIDGLKSVCSIHGCRMVPDEPLREHTTFRVGGKCTAAVFINSEQCAVDVIGFCRSNDIRYTVIGNGSNIIADDGGFDGVVLIIGSEFADIRFLEDGIVEAQAGLLLSRLCTESLREGLTGLEFAYGIPGSVGGAVYMNAGAYGGEMSDVVVSADYIDAKGNIATINAGDMELSYRHSIFMQSGDIIIKVRIKLQYGIKDAIEKRMNELITRRREKQPINYPSAGSTFKRPEGAYAAALIEQCGLKGFSVGDAQVSEKHSGFVINKGNATSEDILKLVEIVKEKVKKDTGFQLELEPEILK
ncbi:MAG: UDP-N-acetylmuramate dehydrogenase [Oscillospiraceae bacterium]|nr:UDP-N-acetylmuramate dehydrogenase [Oscillospiraceae bacterium]